MCIRQFFVIKVRNCETNLKSKLCLMTWPSPWDKFPNSFYVIWNKIRKKYIWIVNSLVKCFFPITAFNTCNQFFFNIHFVSTVSLTTASLYFTQSKHHIILTDTVSKGGSSITGDTGGWNIAVSGDCLFLFDNGK